MTAGAITCGIGFVLSVIWGTNSEDNFVPAALAALFLCVGVVLGLVAGIAA